MFVSTKSFLPRRPEKRGWVVVDAADKPLGRLAVKVADMLRGKHRPTYSPQVDTGDFVVVVNAARVKLTGNKEQNKVYQRYSGHRGGLKEIPAYVMRQRHPDQLVRLAVRGMMPKNALARQALKRLKIYAGAEHPHEAQAPEAVEMSLR
jgi:large subunit ribosomal protein L13